MSYRFVDSCRAGAYAPARQLSTNPVWHIPLLSVQWKNSWWWTDELSETCKVSCQNKFVKLVHLVGFITKKFVTMHGHTNVKNAQTVTELKGMSEVVWNWKLRCTTNSRYRTACSCRHSAGHRHMLCAVQLTICCKMSKLHGDHLYWMK